MRSLLEEISDYVQVVVLNRNYTTESTRKVFKCISIPRVLPRLVKSDFVWMGSNFKVKHFRECKNHLDYLLL